MDSYDDGIRDAIKVMEMWEADNFVIDKVRALLNNRVGLPTRIFSSSYICIDCGQPTAGSSNGPLCNCYMEGKKKVVVPVRSKSGPILYEKCAKLCKCGCWCVLDARHFPTSGCRCELLGCPDES